MNPRHLPLDKQTHFAVRVTVDLQTDVRPKKPEMNGFQTAQQVAEDRVKFAIESLLKNSERYLAEQCKTHFLPDYRYDHEPLSIDAMPFDPDWLEPSERLFDDGILFMGRGDYSQRDCAILLARLRDGFSHLSGLQQSGGMGYPVDEEEDAKVAHRIENLARDIVMALTGKECQLLEKQDGTENPQH